MTYRLLNTKETSDYLRLDRGYLAKLRCTGDGPAFVKFGSKVLYREEDLNAYIQSNICVNAIYDTKSNDPVEGEFEEARI